MTEEEVVKRRKEVAASCQRIRQEKQAKRAAEAKRADWQSTLIDNAPETAWQRELDANGA